MKFASPGLPDSLLSLGAMADKYSSLPVGGKNV
jgi:hypothetical protein